MLRGNGPTRLRGWLLASTACAALIATESAQAAKPPFKLVLLGDSYTAGNGAHSKFYTGPSGCYRNHRSWGGKYAQAVRATRAVTYVNRACSGGVIRHITAERAMSTSTHVVVVHDENVSRNDPRAVRQLLGMGRCRSSWADEVYAITPTHAVPLGRTTQVHFRCTRKLKRQLDAVTGDTDMVILSLGGNDVDFSDIIKQCFLFVARSPGDCRGLIEAGRGDLGDVQRDLRAALQAIRRRLPSTAKIVVNSYPYLERDAGFSIGPPTNRYNAGGQIRAFQREADAATRSAVADAGAGSGAEVIFLDSVKQHFGDHVPAASLTKVNTDSWLHGFSTLPAMANYHYNGDGHTQLSNLLRSQGFINGRRAQLPPAQRALDVAFVIDTSESMGRSTQALQERAAELTAALGAQSESARFAVVDFRDLPERTGSPEDYASRVQLGFTSDGAALTAAVQGLTFGYGGDDRETMYSGIHEALGLEWREDAHKLVLVLSDAPPLDPEPGTEYTAQTVIDRALALERAEIHLFQVGGGMQGIVGTARRLGGRALPDPDVPVTVDALVTQTGGTVHAVEDDPVDAAVVRAVEDSMGGPVADAGGPYVGVPGDAIEFDGSGSYVPDDSDIVRWEWDVDGDGTFDASSTEPSLVHSYDAEYLGAAVVRVTDGLGRVAAASVPVVVTIDGDEIPDADDNCPLEPNLHQTDDDLDGLGDECDPTPWLPLATSTDPETLELTPIPSQQPLIAAAGGATPFKARMRPGRKSIAVWLRCTGSAPCAGRVQVARGSRRSGTAYRLEAGSSGRVVVRITASMRRRLPAGRRLKLTITVRDADGMTRNVVPMMVKVPR